jgi:hypothetical protein
MNATPEGKCGLGERGVIPDRLLYEIRESERPLPKPEIIKPSDIEVIEADRTGWLPVTHIFTADEYAKFHRRFAFVDYVEQSPRHEQLRLEVLQDVCRDPFSDSDRSATFVAFTEGAGLVGQVRAGLGRTDVGHPIEAMSLFDASADWPHRLEGVADDEIFEVGRVVVAPGQRPYNTTVILRSLLKKVFDYARERDYKQGYIIMPTKHPRAEVGKERTAPLRARLTEIGAKPELVRGVNLKKDHPVAQTYTGYFGKLDPRVFRWKTIPDLAA